MGENYKNSEKTELCPLCKKEAEKILELLPDMFAMRATLHQRCWELLWSNACIDLFMDDTPGTLRKMEKWIKKRKRKKD